MSITPSMTTQGHVKHYFGTATYRWILEGAAIQAVWTSDYRGRQTQPYGTTFEFFDAARNRWTAIWIYPEKGMYYSVSGGEAEGHIVLSGTDQEGLLQRWSNGEFRARLICRAFRCFQGRRQNMASGRDQSDAPSRRSLSRSECPTSCQSLCAKEVHMNSIMLSIFAFQPRNTFRVMAGLVVISASLLRVPFWPQIVSDPRTRVAAGSSNCANIFSNPDSATSSSVFSTANL